MYKQPAQQPAVTSSVKNPRKHTNNYLTTNPNSSQEKRRPENPREYASNPQQQIIYNTKDSAAALNIKNNKDPLNSLILQYLDAYSYSKTAELFRLESQKPRQLDAKAQLLALFDAANNRDELFAKLQKKLPYYARGTEEYKKLQMYLQIYFLVMVSRKSGQSALDKTALDQFKRYIQEKGSELSENIELIPYFALSYMPEPHRQPAVAHIFKKQWAADLRNQFSKFLTNKLNSKELPRLQQIYLNSLQNNNNLTDSPDAKLHSQTENGKRKLSQPPQLKSQSNLDVENELRKVISELVKKYETLQQNYKEMAEAHKSNILESETKWFSLARDLVRICKKFIQVTENNNLLNPNLNQLVDKIKKWEVFLNNSVEDLITQSHNGLSLFDPSYVDISQQIVSNKVINNRPSINITPIFAIDYSKVRETLLHSDDEKEVCLLLQALRWRITKQKYAHKRREVIMSYTINDILGLKPENRALMYSLFDQNTEIKKEYSLRLVNAIASDFNGRTYIISNLLLAEILVNTCKSEAYEGAIRRCALNALQKISLRSSAQLFMIDKDIIKWIVKTIRMEKDEISEITLEYLTALLMNMTLKKSGKIKCQIQRMLQLLIDLLEIDIPETRTFLCGSIFSLLDWPPIAHEAEEIKLTQQLSKYLHEPTTTQFTKQITYIIQKIEQPNFQQPQESDDQDQENDIDNIDQEDYDEDSEDPDDDEEEIAGAEGLPKGQELLVKRYSSVGPEAARQECLTRSILQEATKKNLEASLIRERKRGETNNLFKTNTQAFLKELSREESAAPAAYDSSKYLPNYNDLKKSSLASKQKQSNVHVSPTQKIQEQKFFEAHRQLPRTPPHKQK